MKNLIKKFVLFFSKKKKENVNRKIECPHRHAKFMHTHKYSGTNGVKYATSFFECKNIECKKILQITKKY
jgi:hypothetical protein